ncbi:bifunctional 23S rRNA (guanine(2069)-N(7))-methyltransferase RlmK/23S rRNA (guanine(2445)-N(2))-methyltransferase RlmL [Catenovulum sp. SM1970]|uniref:bifunctional 23S rRNA (guanine(2069)-N(7))-methyltransferase RlmK/23S rRNA (guanine(2445)-N(2))-methyltransferase RlmL n=1 Tax=Marinifaba aquimaris TaxID=2741323 RepID=UPI001572919E|nr:bifunctional 23S rRNA (guanine(2069)-N(7))-methyltransferase RlmK/23S rRNA (guanine(2445)-N(2))-methyltransferase RlmL [Marinifaba aquimaris]NTS77357.1 bifunctional 23S rRNA (guanine(2069)-N(7))-methyltransferase RlmK/23S rRNA (guanine(2445)-N(2))-methyltransferase RlmL [Marinifaba aquimaris]
MPKFLVTSSKGLENLLHDELVELGVQNVKLSGSSVLFEDDLALGYRVCYRSRFANRVLLELNHGDASNKEALYQTASAIDWTMQFDPKSAFNVSVQGTNGELRNTQFSAQVIKDAVVDFFEEEGFKRPNVEKGFADIRIQARINRKQVSIYLDFSGASLHERGYREDAGRAPLKENLAAALISRSGWLADTSKPLCDFFCGSGTLAIEAALMGQNIPAQYKRFHWGFDAWMGHRSAVFEEEKAQADALINKDVSLNIFASDINGQELDTAESNAIKADVRDAIQFVKADVLSNKVKNFWKKAGQASGHIIINPPYGERLEELSQVANLYLDLGQKLKREFADWHLTIITSAQELLKFLKLSADKKYKVKNATLDCVLATYQIEASKGDEIRQTIAEEFQNRLKKNIKKLAPLARKADTNAYRVYDADLPNYNVAIDLYADHCVIQEYAAPKSVPEHVAEQRLNEVLITAPSILNIPGANVHVKTRRKQKGKEQYQRAERKKNKLIEVFEGPAKFLVNLDDYLDTGLFLDHRDIRQLVREKAKDLSVLNLFSYTCAVSVHAAIGGAKQVCSVDLSKTYLNWGEQNFEANGIKNRNHKFERGDCVNWMKMQRRQFDLIFIDPPSFSNSKKMSDVFDVQRDHIELLTDAKQRLNDGGTIIFSNNLRSFKLDEASINELGLTIEDVSKQTLPFDFARNPKIRQCWILKADS